MATNTADAEALVLYALTRNIDYRYPLCTERSPVYADYADMMAQMQTAIEQARIDLRLLGQASSDMSEHEVGDHEIDIEGEFVEAIPILTAMHADDSGRIFDKFVRKWVQRQEKQSD